MRIALLGLGLIGGSIARAVAARGWEVHAWTPAGVGPGEASGAGIARAASSAAEAIDGAELVVLAAPPHACVDLVRDLGGPLRARLGAGTTVTDVASVKGPVTEAARAAGIPFVGGHPMAGRETSGFGAASADLFTDRPWVITEAVNGGDPARVAALAAACGARTLELAAARHDALVAAISHLPLIASVALVEAVAGSPDEGPAADWPDAAALAATGWASMTRLALGDPVMGAGIAAANAEALTIRLRAYRARLDAWIEALEDPAAADPAGLEARLSAVRDRLRGSAG